MSDQPVMTTAEALNDFRRELLSGGYTEDEAGHLAAIALKSLIDDGGIVVREAVAQ